MNKEFLIRIIKAMVFLCLIIGFFWALNLIAPIRKPQIFVNQTDLQKKCEDMGGRLNVNWDETFDHEYKYRCQFYGREDISNFQAY